MIGIELGLERGMIDTKCFLQQYIDGFVIYLPEMNMVRSFYLYRAVSKICLCQQVQIKLAAIPINTKPLTPYI